MISNEKEFWTVGYSQWGRWQVRKSPVTDPYRYSLMEDLGSELLGAAIEADGEFIPPANKNHFEFISDGLPWLAFITTDNRLWVKRVQESMSQAVLIATDVVQVSLCRGWRSTTWSVDAGLYCAYLTTTGDVYLREYITVDSVRSWSDPQLICQNATKVQAVRLLDYRMGIRVEPGNQLFISERSYIGGTSRTEYADAVTDCDFLVFSTLDESLPEPTDSFSVVSASVYSDNIVEIIGNFPFYSFDPNWADVTCLSNNTVERYYIENGNLYVVLVNPISTELKYVRLQVRGVNRIRFQRTPQSRPIVPEFTVELMEPFYVTEIGSAHISSSVQFSSKMWIDYQEAITEIAEVQIQSVIDFSIVERNDLTQELTEYVSAAVTSSMLFSEQQVGDVPI